MMTLCEQLRGAAGAALVSAWALAGCVADTQPGDAGPEDASASGDAEGEDGAPAADASVSCPDGARYEVRATSWMTGEALSGVGVVELRSGGDSGATGADGRASLCLGEGGARVSHDRADVIPWLAEVSGDAARTIAAEGDRFDIPLLSPIEADELFLQVFGISREPGDGQIVVEIRDYPSGEPLRGARAELAGTIFTAVYTGSPSDAFAAGDTLDGGELIFFANVERNAVAAEVVVTPPSSYDGECAASETALIDPDAITFVPVVCSR